jgi:hypothetical protein
MKTTSRFARLLLVASTLFLLGGCVAAIGNGESRPIQPTVGQQLIDLKKARATGALSEPEYAEQRAKLLARK